MGLAKTQAKQNTNHGVGRNKDKPSTHRNLTQTSTKPRTQHGVSRKKPQNQKHIMALAGATTKSTTNHGVSRNADNPTTNHGVSRNNHTTKHIMALAETTT
jgi:hypothetical protein